jgi:ribosome-binding factor A
MNKKHTPKAPTQRQLQVGELLRHALSEIFFEGKYYDAALDGTSITVAEVRMSPDLQNATVFVMPLGGTKDSKGFLQALKRLTPALRSGVAKKVQLRYTPELAFKLDNSFEQVSKMNNLLKSLDTSPEATVDPTE